MDLDWSEQSPHIRTLFRPWQPGDGYTEEDIAAGEARCDLRLPVAVRSFYGTWGRRRDLTRMNEDLLGPDAWAVHSNALIFCAENQGCAYWALPLEMLGEKDPPVVVADDELPAVWEVTDGLIWRASHQRASSFLDDLTYRHAFAHGAVHGARSGRLRLLPWQTETLERNWQTATRTAVDLRYPENGRGWPLYVQDGQAIDWWGDCFSAVASSVEALDEVARALAIEWVRRW